MNSKRLPCWSMLYIQITGVNHCDIIPFQQSMILRRVWFCRIPATDTIHSNLWIKHNTGLLIEVMHSRLCVHSPVAQFLILIKFYLTCETFRPVWIFKFTVKSRPWFDLWDAVSFCKIREFTTNSETLTIGWKNTDRYPSGFRRPIVIENMPSFHWYWMPITLKSPWNGSKLK